MLEVPREQLLALLELAEDSIDVQYGEFSNRPSEEDRDLMLAMWRVAGKEVPEFFRRTFGWKI